MNANETWRALAASGVLEADADAPLPFGRSPSRALRAKPGTLRRDTILRRGVFRVGTGRLILERGRPLDVRFGRNSPADRWIAGRTRHGHAVRAYWRDTFFHRPGG